MRIAGLVVLSMLAACAAAPNKRGPEPLLASNPAAGQPPVNQELVKAGYAPNMYKGQLVYCRSEAVTGTTFRSKVCQSEAAIKDREQKTRDEINSVHPRAEACPNRAC